MTSMVSYSGGSWKPRALFGYGVGELFATSVWKS